MLGLGVGLDELDAQHLILAFGHTGIHGEAVFLVLLDADAKETLVGQSGPPVAVSRGGETGIVGIAVEGAVVLYLHLAKGLPAHEVVGGELKRAVLHQLSVETAVGSEVDILEEDSIHGGLHHGSGLTSVDSDYVILSLSARGYENCSSNK